MKSYDKPRQLIKKQRHHFTHKGLHSQSYGFSSSHVWIWYLDYNERWVQNNWCFWIVVLNKTLESPLDCKEIQPVHSERDQSWDFFGRNDAKAETPVLWPPHVKSWLTGKDPDAGKDCRQEEKGMTEDEMVGWHHWLDGHRFGWTLGIGDGQGGLACCGSWSCKESDTTEWLNWTELTRWTFVGKVMSLLFNILSRLLITFLPRSEHLWISWLQSPSAVILEPKKIKSGTVPTVSPSICLEVMGPDAMIFVFWTLSFNQLFHSPLSLSSRGFLVPLHFLP